MSEAAETLDGWYSLHDFRSLDWAGWKALPAEERDAAVKEFRQVDRIKQKWPAS